MDGAQDCDRHKRAHDHALQNYRSFWHLEECARGKRQLAQPLRTLRQPAGQGRQRRRMAARRPQSVVDSCELNAPAPCINREDGRRLRLRAATSGSEQCSNAREKRCLWSPDHNRRGRPPTGGEAKTFQLPLGELISLPVFGTQIFPTKLGLDHRLSLGAMIPDQPPRLITRPALQLSDQWLGKTWHHRTHNARGSRSLPHKSKIKDRKQGCHPSGCEWVPGRGLPTGLSTLVSRYDDSSAVIGSSCGSGSGCPRHCYVAGRHSRRNRRDRQARQMLHGICEAPSVYARTIGAQRDLGAGIPGSSDRAARCQHPMRVSDHDLAEQTWPASRTIRPPGRGRVGRPYPIRTCRRHEAHSAAVPTQYGIGVRCFSAAEPRRSADSPDIVDDVRICFAIRYRNADLPNGRSRQTLSAQRRGQRGQRHSHAIAPGYRRRVADEGHVHARFRTIRSLPDRSEDAAYPTNERSFGRHNASRRNRAGPMQCGAELPSRILAIAHPGRRRPMSYDRLTYRLTHACHRPRDRLSIRPRCDTSLPWHACSLSGWSASRWLPCRLRPRAGHPQATTPTCIAVQHLRDMATSVALKTA